MIEDTMSVCPASMNGQGGYDRHSGVQASGGALARPLLMRAACEALSPEGDEAFTAAEYS
ncbi:hypothetical protein [Sabulicella glaciei]|uniref:Uncharacterized protein n=1 Tax=Sabulicella glaciei TaxID=2984948 RepID=A0ABT3NSA1_9PROT|nr:hypothetical protein [Roseococcus sp. MDT2-1-1]MCW8085036.1 hypothetical protein [Roseococcus sp. MDT2-1-1]